MNYFLDLFRSPKGSYKVMLMGVISLLVSHFFYLYESTSQNLSIVHTKDYLLVSIFWTIMFERVLWCFLSSKPNIILYFRFSIMISWTILIHRLIFGVESAGSLFFNLMFLTFTTPWIPFALLGYIPKKVTDLLGLNDSKTLAGDNVIKYQRANDK